MANLTILTIIYCKQITINNIEKFYNILKQNNRIKEYSNSTIQLR